MWVIRAEHEENRYSAFLDGQRIGHAAWVLVGNLVIVPHTRVEAPYLNAGVGTDLARDICEHARADGLSVVAGCDFMHRFSYLHPTYDSVLRAAHPGELEALAPLIQAAVDYEERRLHVFPGLPDHGGPGPDLGDAARGSA